MPEFYAVSADGMEQLGKVAQVFLRLNRDRRLVANIKMNENIVHARKRDPSTQLKNAPRTLGRVRTCTLIIFISITIQFGAGGPSPPNRGFPSHPPVEGSLRSFEDCRQLMSDRYFCYSLRLRAMLCPMRVFSAQNPSYPLKNLHRPTSTPFDYVLN